MASEPNRFERYSMCTINSVPDEVLSLILAYTSCRDVVRFGSTCIRFNNMVSTDQILWKHQFKCLISPDVADMIEEHFNPNWYDEVKRYFSVKYQIYAELKTMSARFFLRTSEIGLQDVRNFFKIALSHHLNYHYAICILRGIIKTCRKTLAKLIHQKPHTLTEMHYARVALRHLKHTFLTLKWVKAQVKRELTPEIVVNFFLQWIDTDNSYPDADVKRKIEELAKKVEVILEDIYPSEFGMNTVKQRCEKKLIPESDILAAITRIVYTQRKMAVTSTASIDTLNIVRVVDTRCGNAIVVGAIFYTIAKQFFVNCILVAFPNHLFIEWVDLTDHRKPMSYTIDLSTGLMRPKRQCPFSSGRPLNVNQRYNPDSMLQYIYSSFHMTMAAIKNGSRQIQNASHMLDFLGNNDNDFNPYRNFLAHLLHLSHLPAMDIPLNLKYLLEEHMGIIQSLSNLNAPTNAVTRIMTQKRHDGRVRYGVGMICFHKKYDYMGIVRGWDLTCAIEWQQRVEVDSLQFGANQPFYYVMVMDQSERYVAQENLFALAQPSRLFHLEDLIAREFSHFDGYAYVSNEEKLREYPDDGAVVEIYRFHNNCFPRR